MTEHETFEEYLARERMTPLTEFQSQLLGVFRGDVDKMKRSGITLERLREAKEMLDEAGDDWSGERIG